MKYEIVESYDSDKLAEMVMALLKEGWDLQGGVSVSRTEYEYMNEREGYKEVAESTVFAQALIRPDTTSEPPPEDPHSDSSNPEGTSP